MLTPDKYDLSGLTFNNRYDYGVTISSSYSAAHGYGVVTASYNGIQSQGYSACANDMADFQLNDYGYCANKALESLKYKVSFIYSTAKQIKCWPEVVRQINRLSNKGDVSKVQWLGAFDGDNMYLYGKVTRQLQYGQSTVGVEVFIRKNNKVLIKMCGRQATIKNID